MFDFGDSRWAGFLEVDRARCAMKLPLYVDLDFASGVKGEVLITIPDWRGEGVSGIRPPAVRLENSALCDLIGVDTVAVAMTSNNIKYQREMDFPDEYQLKKMTVIIDCIQDTLAKGSWEISNCDIGNQVSNDYIDSSTGRPVAEIVQAVCQLKVKSMMMP